MRNGRTSLWINGTRKKIWFPAWDHVLSAKEYVLQVRSQLEGQLKIRSFGDFSSCWYLYKYLLDYILKCG